MVHSDMQPNVMTAAANLSDGDLLRRVAELAGRERRATVELIAHLAELDRRRLYREQGYGSVFSYCIEVLHLAEHAAFNRIEAARASRAFPVILDLLAEGAVNLSTVRLLAPHLTPENHERVLVEARGRSKREVQAIVARLAPQPDVPASVRKLPSPTPVPAPPTPTTIPVPLAANGVTRPAPTATPPVVTAAGPNPSPPVTPAPVQRPVIAALTPERYRIQFTVSRETQEKLRRVQGLLRREIPDGDPGAIFDRALTLLLEDVARKKFAATTNPRPGQRADPRSRHVSAEVKRKVWLRDHGQCAFVSPSGRRCRERTFLEFHHVDPYALGGEATVSNLALRCREHNIHEAELVFGRRDPVVGETRASYSA